MLIHLGDAEGSEHAIATWVNEDCDLEIILGNNDFFSCLDKEKELMIGRYKTLLTHGHYYNVSVGAEYLKQEPEPEVSISLCSGIPTGPSMRWRKKKGIRI